MLIPDVAIELVKKYEGLHDGDLSTPMIDPYHDPIGLPTIGWGHLLSREPWANLDSWSPISLEQAEDLLKVDLESSAARILALTRVPLTVNQFSALLSFVFNLGSGSYQRSTLRMKLNRGEYEAAANEFWKWRRAGGKILRGLVRRRAEETDIWRLPSPVYVPFPEQLSQMHQAA